MGWEPGNGHQCPHLQTRIAPLNLPPSGWNSNFRLWYVWRRISPVDQLNLSVLWHFVLGSHRTLESKLDWKAKIQIFLMMMMAHTDAWHMPAIIMMMMMKNTNHGQLDTNILFYNFMINCANYNTNYNTNYKTKYNTDYNTYCVFQLQHVWIQVICLSAAYRQ